MKLSVTLYSVVTIRGSYDPRKTCERYLYRATRIVEDGEYRLLESEAAFVLATTYERDVRDTWTSVRDLMRECSHGRTYQLDRFASGMYGTREFETQDEATMYAVELVTAEEATQ